MLVCNAGLLSSGLSFCHTPGSAFLGNGQTLPVRYHTESAGPGWHVLLVVPVLLCVQVAPCLLCLPSCSASPVCRRLCGLALMSCSRFLLPRQDGGGGGVQGVCLAAGGHGPHLCAHRAAGSCMGLALPSCCACLVASAVPTTHCVNCASCKLRRQPGRWPLPARDVPSDALLTRLRL